MRPLKLTLKNFIGIRSGLGRDEIVINFEELAGDAQLVALVGPNGAGKSTTLDNAHPYRIMPSRAGSYSPGSFSFYDNVYGSEALKELDFSHGGQVYRSVLSFRMTAKTKKCEAYLMLRTSTGWTPANMGDGTISDGKTDTYDRVLESVMGTPELYFTAAFASQNRRSLSSYTNGEIKGLMSELLGLDAIREMGAKAGTVNKLLKANLEGMRDTLAQVAANEAQLDDEISKRSGAVATNGLNLQARLAARTAVSTATRQLADVQATENQNAGVEMRHSNLLRDMYAADVRNKAVIEQVAADKSNELLRKGQAQGALRREIEANKAEIAGLEKQIQQNQALLTHQPELEAVKKDAHEDEAILAAARITLAEKVVLADEFLALNTSIVALYERLQSIKQQGIALKAESDILARQAELAGDVPCADTDLQPLCPLLKSALAAKDQVAGVESLLIQKRAELASERETYLRMSARRDTMGEPVKDRDQAALAVSVNESACNNNNKILAMEAGINQAAATIDHASAQISRLNEVVRLKGLSLISLEEEHVQFLVVQELRLTTAQSMYDEEHSRVAAEIKLLPPAADTSALATAEESLRLADSNLARIEAAVEDGTARIARHKATIEAIERALLNATTIKATASKLETEIAQWTLLTRALGNDGIIALSIDDAGPTLASLANDLLLSCYGPRFSVSIRTQEANQKGELKETFDIRVFDAETDDEKSVRDMSGGEKIFINECLTRAVALYLTQMSGQRYETLFADESDGALDPDKKRMFMRMKKKVLEIGGYDQEFFISHTPELQEMADVRIDMNDFRARM